MDTVHRYIPSQGACWACVALANSKGCCRLHNPITSGPSRPGWPQTCTQCLCSSVVQPSTKFHARARLEGAGVTGQVLNPMQAGLAQQVIGLSVSLVSRPPRARTRPQEPATPLHNCMQLLRKERAASGCILGLAGPCHLQRVLHSEQPYQFPVRHGPPGHSRALPVRAIVLCIPAQSFMRVRGSREPG